MSRQQNLRMNSLKFTNTLQRMTVDPKQAVFVISTHFANVVESQFGIHLRCNQIKILLIETNKNDFF
jgi:hypothetical protein